MMLVAGLVAVAVAQRPQPCYAPEQFTAKAFYTDTEREQKHERYVTITYDGAFHFWHHDLEHICFWFF
jgi:hypothetical protein